MACNPVDLPRANILTTLTQIFQGTFHPHMANKTSASNRLDVGWGNRAQKVLEGLDRLQVANNTPIHQRSLRYSLQYESRSQPQVVRDSVFVSPHIEELFGADLDDEEFIESCDDTFAPDNEGNASWLGRLTKNRLVIWPVDGGDNFWVVLILLLEESDAFNRPGVYDSIQAWHVSNPDRGASATDISVRSAARVMYIITEKGGIEWDGGNNRFLYVPPMNTVVDVARADIPKDNFSTGIRAFALVRELLARFTKAISRNMDEEQLEDELWQPLSGWLNIDKVRRDMIEACSNELIRVLGHRARLAAFPISDFYHEGFRHRAVDLRVPDHRQTTIYAPNDNPDGELRLEDAIHDGSGEGSNSSTSGKDAKGKGNNAKPMAPPKGTKGKENVEHDGDFLANRVRDELNRIRDARNKKSGEGKPSVKEPLPKRGGPSRGGPSSRGGSSVRGGSPLGGSPSSRGGASFRGGPSTRGGRGGAPTIRGGLAALAALAARGGHSARGGQSARGSGAPPSKKAKLG
ncbi:hypothetical protein BJ170DRAFT_731958 [Xylariales sp. AK1849]|nr:hypothetical protein BJ170DRAFT_731958 [Xylariales sp. AK1849]